MTPQSERMRRETFKSKSAGSLGGLFAELEPLARSDGTPRQAGGEGAAAADEAAAEQAKLDERRRRAAHAETLARLKLDAVFLAERFKLPLRSIDAESRRVKRRYGICYDDGSIKIRLHNVRTGDTLKYSAIVDTLCHELAHLRHFNHGPRFQVFYRKLLEYARRNSIYRPEPRRIPRPLAQRTLAPRRPTATVPSAQLDLFS